MRTTLASLVCVSSEALKTTIGGETSIGFQIVPVISSTRLDLPGSLQVTVADFVTLPLKLSELNWSGMRPVFPGWTRRSQVPAVVQLHPGRTSVISSKALPVLVNAKSCLTNSPALTLPKSKTWVANSIWGPDVPGAPAADFVPDSGVGASACARHEAILPNVPATINNVTSLVLINISLSQMSRRHARK